MSVTQGCCVDEIGGVELPIMADNASITSAGIIDADSPPTIMVAAVKLVEIGMILEEVLTHANAAVNVRPTAIMPVVVSNEGEWQAHALRALDKVSLDMTTLTARDCKYFAQCFDNAVQRPLGHFYNPSPTCAFGRSGPRPAPVASRSR